MEALRGRQKIPCPLCKQHVTTRYELVFGMEVRAGRKTERLGARGGTIHRCINISRYFCRYTYRDIFYNFFFFLYNEFHLGRRYIIISTCNFCK